MNLPLSLESTEHAGILPVSATNIVMVSTDNNTTLTRYSGQKYRLAMSS